MVKRKAEPVEQPESVKTPKVAGSASEAVKTTLAPIAAGLTGTYSEQVSKTLAAATAIMNQFDLVIGTKDSKRYRIVEVEVYVNGPPHRDPYTHGDEGQACCGVWYFHRKGGSFKAGSFKGMDLACGDGSADVHSGMLIRAIRALSGKEEVIEGPCKVVDHILECNKAKSIADFVSGRPASALDAGETEGLCLAQAEVPRNDVVWSAPRVGLVLRAAGASEPGGTPGEKGEKKTHTAGEPAQFCTRPYRFSSCPERLNKFRAGFAAQAYLLGKDTSPLAMQTRHLEEYIAAAEKGSKHSDPKQFVDKTLSTQPLLCELTGACHKLLGSLG